MGYLLKEEIKKWLEHEHPLNRIDLWSEQLKHEEEYEEDEEENEDELIAKQAFRCLCLPKEITHTYHPNHLLSRVYYNSDKQYYLCRMCGPANEYLRRVSFSCYNCDFHLHPECALLIPETTTHKCDKHPMKLSFLPIENHKIEYFCEICEEDLNPNLPFYHCHECMQSIHFACAPSIVRYETCPTIDDNDCVYRFVNVKFGGTYSNTKMHPHPLSFVQGVESDGECYKCGMDLWYTMIFKCLDCKFAIHFHCYRRLVNKGDHT